MRDIINPQEAQPSPGSKLVQAVHEGELSGVKFVVINEGNIGFFHGIQTTADMAEVAQHIQEKITADPNYFGGEERKFLKNYLRERVSWVDRIIAWFSSEKATSLSQIDQAISSLSDRIIAENIRFSPDTKRQPDKDLNAYMSMPRPIPTLSPLESVLSAALSGGTSAEAYIYGQIRDTFESIVGRARDTLQDIPNYEEVIKNIKTEFLAEIERLNLVDEEVDRETFKEMMGRLVKDGKGTPGPDVNRDSPTVQKLIKDYNDDTWLLQEERRLTYSVLPDNIMKFLKGNINKLFESGTPFYQELKKQLVEASAT